MYQTSNVVHQAKQQLAVSSLSPRRNEHDNETKLDGAKGSDGDGVCKAGIFNSPRSN